MGPFIIFAVIVLIAIILVVSNIYVVQQSRAYVIERMGAFERVDGVGLHFKAPFIDRIEVVTEGRVRRSRLYYLRELRGKAARIKPRNRY